MGAAAVELGSPQAPPPHLSIPVYDTGGAAVAANGDGRRSSSSSGSNSNQHHAHAHAPDGPTDQASKVPHPPAPARPAEPSSAARRRSSKPHQQSPRQQQQRPRRHCTGSGRSRLCPSPAALRRARRPLLLALGVTILLLVGSFLVARYKKNLLTAAEWIRGQAPWSAVYFSIIVFVWIFLCLPSSLVEMVAGMIYSYPTALATVVVGKQLACNLSFVLGRRFLSTSVLMRGEGLLLARLGEEGKEEEEEEAAEAEAAVAAVVAAAEGTASNSSSDGEEGSEEDGAGLSRGSSPVELGSAEGGGAGADGGVEMVGVIGGEAGEVGVEEEEQPPRLHRPPYSNATMQALFLAVESHPWQVVVLLRLLPVPIGAKNYGMAALPVPFYVYCVGTFFAEIPGTVVSTYLGASCRSLLEAINGGPRGGRDQRRRHQELAFLIVGLCVLLLLVALLGRYTRHYRAKLLAEAEMQHRQSLSPAPSLMADAAAAAGGGGRDKEEEEGRMGISAPSPAAAAGGAAAEGEVVAV